MFFNGYADMMHLYKLGGIPSFLDRESLQAHHTLIDVKVLDIAARFCLRQKMWESIKIEELVKECLSQFANMKLHDVSVVGYATWLLYKAVMGRLEEIVGCV